MCRLVERPPIAQHDHLHDLGACSRVEGAKCVVGVSVNYGAADKPVDRLVEVLAAINIIECNTGQRGRGRLGRDSTSAGRGTSICGYTGRRSGARIRRCTSRGPCARIRRCGCDGRRICGCSRACWRTGWSKIPRFCRRASRGPRARFRWGAS
jgi:hypothetical protein